MIDRCYDLKDLHTFFTGHIGSNDAELSSQHLTVIQSQMQSKGGYDTNSMRMQVRHRRMSSSESHLFIFSFPSPYTASVLISASSNIKESQLINCVSTSILVLRWFHTHNKTNFNDSLRITLSVNRKTVNWRLIKTNARRKCFRDLIEWGNPEASRRFF